MYWFYFFLFILGFTRYLDYNFYFDYIGVFIVLTGDGRPLLLFYLDQGKINVGLEELVVFEVGLAELVGGVREI